MADQVKVVVIDDDAEFLELVEFNLRRADFQVHQAENGPDGLKMVKKAQPDVVLLDTTMPGMDGLEVLSELKKGDKTRDIPVFMLTAKTIIGDIEWAFEKGADDYILKPVQLSKLAGIIKTKLQKLKKEQG